MSDRIARAIHPGVPLDVCRVCAAKGEQVSEGFCDSCWGSDRVPAPSTVPRVPNKRKEGQKLGTFWLPQEEWDAAIAAAKELDVTVTDECRRALRNMVKRAERKRAGDGGRCA